MKKAWDKLKADSKVQLAKAKGKLKRKDRQHVNLVVLTAEEVLAFRNLDKVLASVKELRARAVHNKAEHKKAKKSLWAAIEAKYVLGGKYHVDLEKAHIYQLGKKI